MLYEKKDIKKRDVTNIEINEEGKKINELIVKYKGYIEELKEKKVSDKSMIV